MRLRIYLDTSVFSAYYDGRLADRKMETEQFWQKFHLFEISTSETAKEELSQTPHHDQRSRLLRLLEPVKIISVTQEIKELAQQYLSAGIFTPTMFNDALHVAAAVMTRQDVLLSWNFKHLVNRHRRAAINQLNVVKDLPVIEILAPPEV